VLVQSTGTPLAAELVICGPIPLNVTYLLRGQLANDLDAAGQQIRASIHVADNKTRPDYFETLTVALVRTLFPLQTSRPANAGACSFPDIQNS
jgi:hypothetical protein